MKNCWEIYNCGRHEGGECSSDVGTCIVAKWGLGHSCWVSAELIPTKDEGLTLYTKKLMCHICEVYKLYNRSDGIHRNEVSEKYPDEEKRYQELVLCRDLELN